MMSTRRIVFRQFAKRDNLPKNICVCVYVGSPFLISIYIFLYVQYNSVVSYLINNAVFCVKYN
jgi:hypothetical protein